MEQAAPRKKVPSWVFGMAIILAPSLAFLGLVAAGVRVQNEHRDQAPTALDHALVITAKDLGVTADPKREVFTKVRQDDGSLRLTYRFPVELMPDEAVALECIVERALDEGAAKRRFEMVDWEVRKSFSADPALLAWGDESRAGTVLKEGRPVGTFFSARKDRFVFVFRVTGAQLDAEKLKALLLPRLEQLTRFDTSSAVGSGAP
ncbi:MAG: hypothetical protein IPJ65_31830 [Archangiaceae bacterium]|nr:hypothetical protein [Archangiaceae bacterium]